jgi:predicted chitinase
MLTITREAWMKFAPGCPQPYADALFGNMGLLESAGILENERRWCHWAATVYHETGGFKEIRESLHYTTTGALRKAWPSRFGHKSDDELKPLLRNPVGLADMVYGCYSGRDKAVIGDVGPGEAFAWRGGGWFNTTFKPSVDRYCAELGLVPTPANALDDPVLTLRMAVLEWIETDCNQWADENQIRKVAKAINTGSATSGIEPVGMDARKVAFARAWKQWGESGDAEVPAREVSMKEIAAKATVPVLGTAEVVRQAVTASPDPTPHIETTKRVVESASLLKSIATTGADFLGWVAAHPGMLGAAVLAVAAVWFGPALWRKFA